MATKDRKRSFGIRSRKIAALKAQVGKTSVPNPYTAGFYYFAIEALKHLGANRPHSIASVISAFRRTANVPSTFKRSGTFWQRWKRKDATLTPRQRFVVNLEVLQRVARPGRQNRSAYGEKLKQIGPLVLGTKGVVIDIRRASNGKMLVKLNTDSEYPINEFRTQRDQSHAATRARFRKQQYLAQAGRCAICSRQGRLCVDHCHAQHHLRGLLCRPCNLGLGQFEDSPTRLMRAAIYLMDAMRPRDERVSNVAERKCS